MKLFLGYSLAALAWGAILYCCRWFIGLRKRRERAEQEYMKFSLRNGIGISLNGAQIIAREAMEKSLENAPCK